MRLVHVQLGGAMGDGRATAAHIPREQPTTLDRGSALAGEGARRSQQAARPRVAAIESNITPNITQSNTCSRCAKLIHTHATSGHIRTPAHEAHAQLMSAAGCSAGLGEQLGRLDRAPQDCRAQSDAFLKHAEDASPHSENSG